MINFFDVAVAANANFIVTNDAHFNLVKNLLFSSVNIISASEFKKLLTRD
jgi:predicted nucleic acid-binding protein